MQNHSTVFHAWGAHFVYIDCLTPQIKGQKKTDNMKCRGKNLVFFDFVWT